MVRHSGNAAAQVSCVGTVASVMDVSSPYRGVVNRAARARTGPTKKQVAAAERAAVVLRSALDAATERALRERTPESRRAVLFFMGKGT